MGEVFRRYWLPAFLAERLPEPDCPPIAVKLLGERLVAFRDTSGRIGILQENCPHRGASLTYARCEENGLRCIYHGWKLDVAGDVLEAPAEPRPERFFGKVFAKHYPTREAGGIVWTYMGPPEFEPEFPLWRFTQLPPSHVLSVHYLQDCNYFQAIEGDFDPAHASFLHYNLTEFRQRYQKEVVSRFYGFDRVARTHNVATPWGLDTIYRWQVEDFERPGETDETRDAFLVQPFCVPCFSNLPAYGIYPYLWHAFVPVDDEHHLLYYVHYFADHPFSVDERQSVIDRFGHDKCDRANEYRPMGTRANHHLQDQASMNDLFSGIRGIAAQDIAITQSQGVLLDRSTEHLGQSDAALAYIRRYLLNLMHDVSTGGKPPHPSSGREYSGLDAYMVMAPKSAEWQEVTRGGKFGREAQSPEYAEVLASVVRVTQS
jgi:phenylpropionate dioxygenase-like ring-hydroxylating dioxygenase large terminal subunit